MKYRLVAFAIAASLFPMLAAQAADNALMAKVRINAPIYALLLVCDLRPINAAADNGSVLAGVKSGPAAQDLMRRLHGEAQAAYIKARDAGNRLAFCRDFIAANSQYAKARVTAVTEGYLSGVNARARTAIGHDVCKQGDAVKLSKADREGYETMQRILRVEQKIAREDAQAKGWNVTEEVAAVTDQFCMAVNNP